MHEKPRQFRKPLFGRVILETDGSFKRLLLPESYRSYVRWGLRVLTTIGLGTVWLSIPSWQGSLAVSLVLLAAQQFLQRIVFTYSSMLVLPLPDFDWDGHKWLAVIFGYPDRTKYGPHPPTTVGLLFDEEAYARRVHALLRSWHQGLEGPDEDNLRLSFVLDEEFYYVFLYPSLCTKSQQDLFEKHARQTAYEKKGSEHFPMTLQMVICKRFNRGVNSALDVFLGHWNQGEPFAIMPFYSRDGIPEPLADETPILKRALKAKTLDELDKSDQERFHIMNFVDDVGLP